MPIPLIYLLNLVYRHTKPTVLSQAKWLSGLALIMSIAALPSMSMAANDKPATYVGRVKPSVNQVDEWQNNPSSRRHYSSGSYREPVLTPYDAQRRVNRASRSGISAQIYYQAPTTTTIERTVQIIPPQHGVGDVYYSQDSYYIYPPVPPTNYPYRYNKQYQPYVPVVIDRQSSENRSKQWTDKSDFDR